MGNVKIEIKEVDGEKSAVIEGNEKEVIAALTAAIVFTIRKTRETKIPKEEYPDLIREGMISFLKSADSEE